MMHITITKDGKIELDTLDDLEDRLTAAIERGEIDEQEAWLEMREAEAAYLEARRDG